MNDNLLAKYRKRAGYSQVEVAKALNVTQGSVSAWEKGRWEPDKKSLIRLAELYGVTVDALLGRPIIQPREWREIQTVPQIYPETEVMLPLVASLRCGLDSQGVPFTFIKSVPVPISYVRRWGDDLRLIMAVGDSMSPTIIPEDMLVCKPTSTWESGQVVVVNVNDCDMVKRIFRTEDGGIELRSDNPSYPVLHFTPDELAEDCVHVLGRVMIPIPKEL